MLFVRIVGIQEISKFENPLLQFDFLSYQPLTKITNRLKSEYKPHAKKGAGTELWGNVLRTPKIAGSLGGLQKTSTYFPLQSSGPSS